MTFNARKVLADCRLALTMLEEETDLDRWRVHWAGAVALLRTVGYTLKNVDSRNSSELQKAADRAFKEWKSGIKKHEIFVEFIDRERNNILKEYNFNYYPQEEVQVVVRSTLQSTSSGSSIEQDAVFSIGENIYRPMLEGFREGDDVRDVFSEAIEWWDEQLSQLEEFRTASDL